VATLTVLEFDTADGAERMIRALEDLQRQQLIRLLDAAVVSWEKGKKKPKTRQLANVAAAGAMGGAFWGLLFGLIFFVPLFGLAVGAGIGALSGALTDVGIDDDFIKKLRNEITEGTSALFLLSADEVPDRLAAELRARDIHFTLAASNLTQEQEARLREVFGAE
jgi:uncharacterized membrane protein